MPAPAAVADGVWAPERRQLTVGLVLAVTLVAFEALSVATILPVVSRQLGDLRLYGWVFSGFLLSSLVGIVAAGRLADRAALRGPMLAGLLLFASGLVVGGTAVDMPVLVAGRCIQGLGAGAVPAIGYVAIGRAYPQGCRPRMFAVLSTAWVVPGLIGPAIAALIASTVGWRWVFLGLVPMVAATAVLAAKALRGVPAPRAVRAEPLGGVAVAGVVAGAGVALAGLDSGRAVVIGAGLVGGLGLLAVSLRRLTPPATLRAGAGLPATVLNRGLLTLCFYAGDAYVPYALTTVRHTSTLFAGLALTAGTMTWTAGAWVQERRVERWGPRRLVRLGECGVLVALGLMALVLRPGVPVVLGVVAWSVAGLGMGLAYAPLSVATLDRAVPGGEGRATAGLQLCDVLGQALGTGGAGAAVALGVGGLGVRSGVALAFGIGTAAGVAALAVGGRLPRRLLGTRAGGP